jgi:RHS repeat-associated protein
MFNRRYGRIFKLWGKRLTDSSNALRAASLHWTGPGRDWRDRDAARGENRAFVVFGKADRVRRPRRFPCATSDLLWIAPVVVAAGLGFCGPTAAVAQSENPGIPTPTVDQLIDGNAVDIYTGAYNYRKNIVSVGAKGSEFELDEPGTGGSELSTNIVNALEHYTPTSSGDTTCPQNIVVIGHRSFNFCNSSQDSQGQGTTLVENRDSTWTFTDRDGVVVRFPAISSSNAAPGVFTLDIMTTMTFPDGVIVTQNNNSITRNDGFMLNFSLPNSRQPVELVTAINNAVDFCSPTASSCTGLTFSWPAAQIAIDTRDQAITAFSDALNRTTSLPDPTIALSGGPATTTQTLTLPSGLKATFTFNNEQGAGGLVTSVATSQGTWSYAYQVSGIPPGANLPIGPNPPPDLITQVKVTDPHGGVKTYNLAHTPRNDGFQPLLTSFIDEVGRTTSYTYDSSGRRTSQTDPSGKVTTYAYDGRGNITQTTVTPVSGSSLSPITTTASYDSTCTSPAKCNEPNSTTDALGNVTTYTYDPTTGLMLTKTEPAGANGVHPVTAYSYGQIATFIKNSSGQLVQAGAIFKETQQATCATSGGSVSVSGLTTTLSCTAGAADKIVTTTSYSGSNNALPTSVTVAAGDGSLSATTSFAYDPVGNLVSKTDALGATTTYVFDAAREQTGVISADPDGSGPLLNRATSTTFNADGLPTQIATGTTSGASLSSFSMLKEDQIAYDALDRKIQDSFVTGAGTQTVTQFSYDTSNRLTCQAVRMNPSAFGSLPSSACSLGTAGSFGSDRITEFTYDAANEVLTETRAAGSSQAETYATYSYVNPANGAEETTLQTEKDANGNLTTFIYDGFDRLSQTEYPTPSNGGVSSTSDFEQLTYDADSHVTQDRRRDGQVNTKTYDALGNVTSISLPSTNYAYDNLGRLTAATRSGQTLSYTFDALSRETSEAGPNGTLSYQYDLDGRLTRITWPDGFFASYARDALGEVTSVAENGATSGAGLLAQYSYDNLGNRTQLSRGNGVVTAYSYDGAFRLASLQHSFPSGESGNNETLSFTYNPADQVITHASTNPAYQYFAPSAVNLSYAINGQNQVTSAGGLTFGYDGRGNLASDGVNSYGYDGANNLVSFNGTAALSSDGAGRLLQVSDLSGGSPTTASRLFRYDGPALVAEYGVVSGQDAGKLYRRYVPGPGVDETLVWYDSSDTTARRWLLTDELGSVTAVTDAGANALAINTYDEYGQPSSANLGRIQFTGQKWIPEVGLYDYKARDYSPTLGRFLQTDPIGYKDDLDWYVYAHDDPVNGADPTGLATEMVYYRDVLVDGHTFFHTFIVITGNDSRGNSVTAVYRAGPDPNANGDHISGVASHESHSPPVSNKGYGWGNVTAVGGTDTGPGSAIDIESTPSDDSTVYYGGTGRVAEQTQTIFSNNLPTDKYTKIMDRYVKDVNSSKTPYFPGSVFPPAKDSDSFTAGGVARTSGHPFTPLPDKSPAQLPGYLNPF